MTLPAAGVAADVVINPKKSLLAADFADVVNEVKRAFGVIEQKLSQKLSGKATTRRGRPRHTKIDAVRQIRHAAIAAGIQVGHLAHAACGLPVRADLFGICHGSGGALRALRGGWMALGGCCAVIRWRGGL